MMRTRSIVLALASALAGAGASLAQPAQPRDAQPAGASLPDTPAGKVAEAFLAMCNNPTEESVGAFESAYGSAKRRGTTSTQERLGRIREMKSQWQSYSVIEVLGASENGLSLRVRTGAGEPIEMEFQLSTSESGKLDAVLISSGGPATRPEALTPEVLAEAVEGAAKALENEYVFPEVGRKMAEAVRAKLAAGEYASIADDVALARALTDDFQAISKDKHLRVRVRPPGDGPMRHGGPSRDEMARENYGFRKVELLPGNIGYVRFDVFVDDAEAKKTASNALAFLANCDALIFDLRNNGGGSPEMIRYLTTYVFDEPTHLNDMVDREGKVVEEYWTLKDVPEGARRFASDLPVYVLTSGRTFSGAEEFSYNLKNLKRATIVGETTGGGAHPVQFRQLAGRLGMTVPFMRARNPVSGTNWEGTGVEPDVKCAAAEALDRATELARTAKQGGEASISPP
jgi:hypothetical protein